MIFVILQEAAARGELILVDNGVLRWHRRRDGVVVIHEILVQPWAYRQGVGRTMVRQVQERNPGCPLLARCPAEYTANDFWLALGFVCQGREKDNNVWLLNPVSSSAPTETSGTPPLPARQDGVTECASPLAGLPPDSD